MFLLNKGNLIIENISHNKYAFKTTLHLDITIPKMLKTFQGYCDHNNETTKRSSLHEVCTFSLAYYYVYVCVCYLIYFHFPSSESPYHLNLAETLPEKLCLLI